MSTPRRLPPVRPWHREPWPWVIIGLLGATVVASLVTVWIAISNPDPSVVDAAEYQRLQSELRAQSPDDPGVPQESGDRDDGG